VGRIRNGIDSLYNHGFIAIVCILKALFSNFVAFDQKIRLNKPGYPKN